MLCGLPYYSSIHFNPYINNLYFLLLIKSHLQSYPCPLIINYFWNIGFLLGITILLQIITGIFLGLHYTSDINSAYFSLFFFLFSSLMHVEVISEHENLTYWAFIPNPPLSTPVTWWHANPPLSSNDSDWTGGTGLP